MQPAQFPTHVIGYELCKKIPTTALWVLGSLLPPQENYKFRAPPLPLGKISSIMHAFPTTRVYPSRYQFSCIFYIAYFLAYLASFSELRILYCQYKFMFKDIYFIVCRSLILTAVILVPVPTVDSEIEVNIESGDTTYTSLQVIRSYL